MCALHEVTGRNSAVPLETENELRRHTLRRFYSSRGLQMEFGSTTGNRERMVSTHCSSFVLFTRSPGRIRQHHWKQRTNDVDSLFVVCALHEVARKNSAAPLKTECELCRPTLRCFYSSHCFYLWHFASPPSPIIGYRVPTKLFVATLLSLIESLAQPPF